MIAQLNLRLLLLLFIATSCFSCREKKQAVFAVVSGTGIDFENRLPKRDHFNILYYLYYYNGGGVAAGDVNNDGLQDLYFTANDKGRNKLYINKGNMKFEDVTATAGVAGTADWCSGVTMADVNGDGLLDIYVSAVSNSFGLKGHNQLFINKGSKSGVPTFTDSASAYGLNFSGLSTQAAFFDYDHDGDLDCYLLNHSRHQHANIVDTSNRRKRSDISGDVLYRHDIINGRSRFTDVSAASGIYQSNLGYGLGLAIADYNNDGWEDIYVGNDFHENDYYYLNQGNGTFRESGAAHFGHYSRFSMGNDAADYNNDGQMDIITVDMLPPDEKVLKTYGSDENPDIYKVKLEMNGYQHQYSRNCLQKNNGSGSSFSEVGLLNGISATDWSWSPLFADFDNDGIKDLFISTGIIKRPVDLDYVRFLSDMQMRKNADRTDAYDEEMLEQMPDGASHPFFFKGAGEKGFLSMDKDWGTSGMKGYYTGAAYADLDNDGDLDIAMNAINDKAVILGNNAPKKNHLAISFKGDLFNSNGIGTKLYLFHKGTIQYQQMMLTRGFQSSCEPRLHFGLDTVAVIDSLLVVWPDQRYQVLYRVPAGKPLNLHQAQAGGRFDYSSYFPAGNTWLEQVAGTGISWKHAEDEFFDYNVQYLIPHGLSTLGPRLAVADVNGDGVDDVYTCGARNQSGCLMLGKKGGGFAATDTAVFAVDVASEDTDARFFDADGDGDADLYVASGGNVYPGGHPALADRLYINDGKGHFTKAVAVLPELFQNTSCVAVADVDQDQDMDIFAGTLADPKAYGVPQTSYLLLNDGKGKFTVAPQDMMALASIGMVRAAEFSDINKDNHPDLVVAGEWMPVTLFIHDGKTFRKQVLPASTGWWQTIFVDDVNGDGNMDFLAGNWGCNTKFWSGKNGPLKLYVSDFDKNGRTDQLLSYTMDGKEYPFLAKDEVERSLPVLKKHYLKYSEYAGLEMKDAFYGFVEKVQPLIAEKMESMVFLGDGTGKFTLQALPPDLQQAPIFAFQKLASNAKEPVYVAAGNFYNVIPYEGRYDAQALTAFTVRNKTVLPLYQNDLAGFRFEGRDLEWIKDGRGQELLMVAASNDSIRIFRKKTAQ